MLLCGTVVTVRKDNVCEVRQDSMQPMDSTDDCVVQTTVGCDYSGTPSCDRQALAGILTKVIDVFLSTADVLTYWQ